MSKSVFGIATTTAKLSELSNSSSQGFAASEISVLMPDTGGTRDVGHVKATKAPEGATTGAVTGGATGGVIGLLAGIGALAIPGVGPFIAAGPIMAALSGAAVGAATGGILGGLIGLGIPEIEAKRYEEKLKSGNYLIAVHTDESEDVDRAKEIFKTVGAEDISTVSEASAPKAEQIMKKGKSMADENQMDHGPAVSPQAKEKAERGVTHVRKAAEDSVRPQAPWPMNIWPCGRGMGRCAPSRPQFQDDSKQYVRENPTKAVFTALGVGFVLGLIFRR